MIAETSDGLNVYYTVSGQGTPMILVHGGNCDADFMAPLAGEIGDAFRCVSLDRPGYRRSSSLDHDTTISEQVDAISAVDIAASREPSWIFGHSSGGNFALAYGLEYPDMVQGVILMEPALYAAYPATAIPQAVTRMRDEVLPVFREGDIERGLAEFVEVLEAGNPDTFSALADLGLDTRLSENAQSFAHDQPIVIEWCPSDDELAAFEIPILLIEGDQTTRLLRDIVDLLRAKVPNATVATLKDCDHMAPQVQAGKVADAIADFTRQV
jgi:pimeloyl-ACP methyl ester carboxylesterase